ncbi:MAG: GAF domain-containing protein [Dechloromonas sp.]|nr:MAG: GAF domain-containing protein [Dechloromonas sp.]
MNQSSSQGIGFTLMSPVDLQEGVASLSRGAYFKEASLDMTLSLLTESAARVSGIERVSIWALTDDHRELRCLELFELSSGRRSRDVVLHADDYPAYFRVLREEGCVAADDAYLHPATIGFAADYLPRHGITALLDTPIHIRGELQGVLCLEQVGRAQPWTPAHRLFAHAVANLVTLALVEYEAEEARRKASKADERMKVLFEYSRDAMLLLDGISGQVLDANRQAESLFGCRRGDLAGRSRSQLYRLPDGGDVDRLFALQEGKDMPISAEVRRADGSLQPREILSERADVGAGRQLVLEIIRPS